MNQAGFTKDKKVSDHIETLWKLLDRTKRNKEHVNIASIDIKGAYDGVDHLFLFEKLEKWRKLGILNH